MLDLVSENADSLRNMHLQDCQRVPELLYQVYPELTPDPGVQTHQYGVLGRMQPASQADCCGPRLLMDIQTETTLHLNGPHLFIHQVKDYSLVPCSSATPGKSSHCLLPCPHEPDLAYSCTQQWGLGDISLLPSPSILWLVLG